MKVYIVEATVQYEGSWVESVWNNEKDAIREAKRLVKLDKKKKCWADWFVIHECEVDVKNGLTNKEFEQFDIER